MLFINQQRALLAGCLSLGAIALSFGGSAEAQTVRPQQLAQVTSVSQLSDVQPTDWWFSALQSLVERYGCIAGYPDGTYRGNRALTRGEFAAGLNACLDRINELIAAGLADKVSREDLATVQRLQEEFAAELAALSGRVDALEAKTAELEANPLGLNATTSKLGFQVTTGIFAASEPGGATNNAIIPYEINVDFDTSFTGEDLFRIRLQAREVSQFDGDPVGFLFGPAVSGAGSDINDDVNLENVFYNFPLFNGRVDATFGLNDTTPGDTFVFGVPFQPLSDFADLPDVVYDGVGDTSLAFTWEAIEDLFFVSYGFGAGDPNDFTDGPASSVFGGGFFAGPTVHAAELAFTPTDTLIVALAGALTARGQAGAPTGFPLFADTDFAAASIGVTWEITPAVIFSGWYARTFVESGGFDDFDDFLAGFAFPDLFIEGADGGVVVGSPDSATANLIADDDGDFPFYAEVYYNFPITDNITITPGVYYITNVDGDDDDIIVGGVQTTFSF
ncbi:iron uptake porin [Synechococcus sp. PCC 7336]|uniref:iron uptake porin n=1 Tax=Synechococcus sp. PCC 7336 TaxID=195250 RepID=UPI00034537EC|nr:iron uptake porin [Synechococcus sp. PCC 7336]